MYWVNSFTDIKVLNKQAGTIILFVLVMTAFLANLSLLGMKNSLHSRKLTRSLIGYQLALQRAEPALLQGESQLSQNASYLVGQQGRPAEPGKYPQLFGTTLLTTRLVLDKNGRWLDARYVHPTVLKGQVISSYITEKLLLKVGDTNAHYFRITAKGWGFAGNRAVVIQTIIRQQEQLVRVSWQQLP